MDFVLEKWQTSFIPDVAKYGNNKKIADKLRDAFPFPYTNADAEWYVNDCIEKEDKHQICRAIVVDGQAVGSIGIFMKEDVYRKSGELGYWLGEPYWNGGIMTKAVKEICHESFERFDITRIFAEPFSHNSGSRRVLEKADFKLEGVLKKSVCKHDEIYDSCIYALLKK